MKKTKKCQYCDETILVNAKICKHCNQEPDKKKWYQYKSSKVSNSCLMLFLSVILFIGGIVFWPLWLVLIIVLFVKIK